MVTVVNHLAGHAAIDADILAGDEACILRTEVEHHICNVLGAPYAACGEKSLPSNEDPAQPKIKNVKAMSRVYLVSS